MKDFDDIKNKIMNATNGGLDIFFNLFPDANVNRNFKFREERTASASLHQSKTDGVWTLTDFGYDSKPMNAIMVYASERNVDYKIALQELANQYNIDTADNCQPAKPTFKEYALGTAPFQLDEATGYYFDLTDVFSNSELKLLGTYVDADTCKKCNCYKVISMASEVTDKRTGAKKILQRFSTEQYPIFVFVNKHNGNNFYKIYQPKSEDKKYKFMFVGGRPAGFINGMERVVNYYQPKYDAWILARSQASAEREEFNEPEPEKIDCVVICSGERDALNMTSMGYFAVWHNSETAEWEKKDITKLYDNAKVIVNIPDIDDTGIKQGKKLAETFLSIKTLWLPSYLRSKKDFRGNSCKDLTDFFGLHRYNTKSDFARIINSLVDSSLPLQFWESTPTNKGIKYSISNILLNNFLQHFGFFRLEVPGNNLGWTFVKVHKHLVDKIVVGDIFKFIDDFLEKKNMPIELRDLAITSTNITADKLARIKKIDLNFTNFSRTHQTFPFSHETWWVDKNGIKVSDTLTSNYTWSDNVIDKKISEKRGIDMDTTKIRILDDFFSIKKDEKENWQIDIKEQNCDIFNFLINISRVHWQDEFVNTWRTDENDNRTVEEIYKNEENIKYRANHRFSIDGSRLSAEQIQEQIHHLANKIYSIGYLLHSYKDEAQAWALFAMENDMIDDESSHGGSGKSLLTKSFSELINTISRPANDSDLFKDKFLYDGVTEHTNLFVFNDADRMFNMRELYSQITEDLFVNPKNGKPYTVLFKDSPKYAISSNFALRDTNQSTLRRLLIIATSNFYHYKVDGELPGRQPPDDFEGRRFFQNWDVEQYNKYINFYLQCLRFYLATNEKINPPMNSITKRNLVAQIGKHFMDFADEFFATAEINEKGFVEYNKLEFKNLVHNYHKRISGMSSTAIASSLDAYCKLKGYEYMPGRDRFQKQNEDGKLVDYILIYTGKPSSNVDTSELSF